MFNNVERHTHAGLLARGNHIEVRTRFRPSTSRFLAVRVSKLSSNTLRNALQYACNTLQRTRLLAHVTGELSTTLGN